MSEKSELTTLSLLTSSVEGSPARTSQVQAQELESKESGADCGPSLPVSLASFDLDTLSWRTSQRSVLGGWVEYSETWPRAGTMLSGTAYPLPPSVPLTDVIDGSASHGTRWPTPTVGDSKSSGSRNTANSKAHAGISLTDAVRGDGGRGRLEPGSRTSDGSKLKGTGSLNPTWVEWLMGFQLGFTDLDASGTQ
jgi:hypothetical protein